VLLAIDGNPMVALNLAMAEAMVRRPARLDAIVTAAKDFLALRITFDQSVAADVLTRAGEAIHHATSASRVTEHGSSLLVRFAATLVTRLSETNLAETPRRPKDLRKLSQVGKNLRAVSPIHPLGTCEMCP